MHMSHYIVIELAVKKEGNIIICDFLLPRTKIVIIKATHDVVDKPYRALNLDTRIRDTMMRKRGREEEWNGCSEDVAEDDHDEAGVETLHDVENEKKTEAPKGSGPDKRGKAMSALRRSSRRHRLLHPPRFNMLTLRWIAGEREKTGDRMAKKRLGGREVKRQKEKYPSDRIAGKGAVARCGGCSQGVAGGRPQGWASRGRHKQ